MATATAFDRAAFIRNLLAAASRDPRIVGLVDYGSSSEGRADDWSDVDVAVFLVDAAFDAFKREWKAWAAGLGPLLLAYVGGVGHPWAVYDAQPLPLRVDFDFHRTSAIPRMATWPNSPVSADAMVWYDAAGGAITTAAAGLVGRDLGPDDPAAAFERVCGDFWYYLLRTYGRLLRGQVWAARFGLTCMVTGNLLALLRLEAGATARWQASDPADGIEGALAPERLRQLERCIPGPEPDSIHPALLAAAELGRMGCAAVAARHRRAWPRALADRVVALLSEPRSPGSDAGGER